MLIEVTTFRLVQEADVDAFLEADAREQECVSAIKGIVRRTTARSDDGVWAVVTLWWGTDYAQAASDEFTAFVDGGTVRNERFETLD